MDLLVYDENEYFQDWNNPLFSYPYTMRRTIVSTYKFFINRQTIDYEYLVQNINF